MASVGYFHLSQQTVSPTKLHPISHWQWLLSDPGNNLSTYLAPKAGCHDARNIHPNSIAAQCVQPQIHSLELKSPHERTYSTITSDRIDQI